MEQVIDLESVVRDASKNLGERTADLELVAVIYAGSIEVLNESLFDALDLTYLIFLLTLETIALFSDGKCLGESREMPISVLRIFTDPESDRRNGEKTPQYLVELDEETSRKGFFLDTVIQLGLYMRKFAPK